MWDNGAETTEKATKSFKKGREKTSNDSMANIVIFVCVQIERTQKTNKI